MSPFFKKHKEADKADKAAKGKTKSDDKSPAKSAATPTAANAEATPTTPQAANQVPLLNDDDEKFLERLISNDDDDDNNNDARPPLPPRPKTPDLTWESDSDSARAPAEPTTAATIAAKKQKQNRLSRLFSRKSPPSSSLTVPTVTAEEAEREWADLDGVLSNLGIHPTAPEPDAPASAKAKAKSAAVTASAEVQSILGQFVLVLKDIMRGAPTAVDDLVALLDGRNEALGRGFHKLPGSMQRLVMQLPKKLTSSLAPELLAAAAESQGLKKGEAADAKGLARFLAPKNMADLAMTPAIVKSMLKAIVNALKLRWPAFVGTSVLWSTAVVLLLFVLWYCHKRGKEEREKLEKAGAAEGIEGGKEVEGKEATEGSPVESPSGAVVVVEPPAESPRQ